MPLSRSTSSFFDRLFWRPAIRFLVPLSRSAASYSDRLFWRPTIRFPVPLSRSASPFLTGYFDARLSGSRSSLPLRRVLFWPAILTPGYPVSGASLPLRSVSFWPAILPPGYPVFGAPSPAPPRPFLTGYFDAQVSLFRYPRAFFSLPVLVSLVVFFDALLFPTQPSLPGYLGFRLALCAALRLACGIYRSAVFTALRFLPLRSHRFFGGLCSSTALVLAAPQSSPTSGRLALWATLRYACDFYRSAVFTAPRFFPLRFRRFFGGLYSSFLPPGLRPLPGTPCATGSSVASPVGHHSWSSFCTTCLTALGALPLISPVSLLCISYTLGDHRSSRLLNDGTRAPRVLPPPSWDLSAIGN